VYRISVRSSFSSSHELRGYAGDCASLHGHNWGVSTVVEVKDVDVSGMGMDFRLLRECLNKHTMALDHKHLNNLEPFQEINPTAENIARYLYNRLKLELPGGVEMVEVRVEETGDEWASYRE